MVVEFPGSPRPTLGVEWEIALVDKTTRELSNTAAVVFDAVGELPGDTPRLTKEFLRNTVELVTDVHDTVGEAVDDLKESLNLLRRAADPLGVDLMCAGTHPFAQWTDQVVTQSPEYDEMIERTRWWGRQMLIWGVHVHVGVSSSHKVIPILNALLVRYPHMLALSASSPIWAGLDTGYASNRALMFQQLPTAGLPTTSRTGSSTPGSSKTSSDRVSSASRAGCTGTSGRHPSGARWKSGSSTASPT